MKIFLKLLVLFSFIHQDVAFKISHPAPGQNVFSADLMVAIEFLSGIDIEQNALFIRFDGNNNITEKNFIFTSYGSFGSRSDLIFGEAFDLQPGPHTMEVRLGMSWDLPVSLATIHSVSFVMIESCSVASDQPVMVVDSFIFFNELDLLELRLRELWNIVDKFVLVESTQTHSGLEKKLIFTDVSNTPRFTPFHSKLVVVVEDEELDAEQLNIPREERQRDMIKVGLDSLNLSNNTMILISDVDEIPSSESIEKLKQCWSTTASKPTRLLMDWYIYSTAWLSPRPWGLFAREGSIAVTPDLLLRGTPSQWRRALRVDIAQQITGMDLVDSLVGFGTLAGAGWHFSSFGGVEAVKEKLVSYIGANQFGGSEYTDIDRLDRLLRHGVAYFDLATLGSMSEPEVTRGAPHRGGVASFLSIASSTTAPFRKTVNGDTEWEESLPLVVLAARRNEIELAYFRVEDIEQSKVDIGLLNQDARKVRSAKTELSCEINIGNVGGDSEAAQKMNVKLMVDCWGDARGDVKAQVDMTCSSTPQLCNSMLEHATSACNKKKDRYYTESFFLDTAVRFEIELRGSSNGVYLIEVFPWNNIREVAETEATLMGLSDSQTDQLEAFLISKLNDNKMFMFYHNRHWLKN